MPVASKNRSREVVAVLVTTAAMLGIYALFQSTYVQDTWKGWQYQEPANIAQIRSELELTDSAQRIFLATHPAVEAAEAFNEHCDSHREDISLLGCYTGDKMYIYAIDLPELEAANKVTAAHELLHAVWARMGRSERQQVEQLLQQFRQDHAEWAEEELKLYSENEQLEELYTRVATKVRDLPEALEAHYRQYFTNRQKIVEFYESYQAPFDELLTENRTLQTQILQLGQEIDQGRAEYLARMAALEQEITEFNNCADTPGCFQSRAEFTERRGKLEAERTALEALRVEVNQKIDDNNAAVSKYEENQKKLGKLNDAINSNVEEKI